MSKYTKFTVFNFGLIAIHDEATIERLKAANYRTVKIFGKTFAVSFPSGFLTRHFG